MLSEKKLQNLKSKYFPKISSIGLSHKWKDAIQLLHEDPTKGEFSKWMLQQLKNGYKIEDIIPTVKYYHQNNKLFSKKNINEYSNLKELEDEVKNIESKKSEKRKNIEIEKSERTPIWNNDEYSLVRINSKNASQKYGRGTKWCITMSNVSYYETYKAHNIVFYFLLPKVAGKEKYAFSVNRNLEDNSIISVEVFDEEDNSILENDVPYYNEFSSIMINDAKSQPKELLPKIIDGNANKEEFNKFIKIYTDNYKNAKQSGNEEEIDEAIGSLKNLQQYLLNYPKALEFLSKDNPEIIFSMNEENVPLDKLLQLVNNKSFSVRKNVVEYQKIPPEVLLQLANDEDINVKRNIAKNSNTPPEALLQLVNDEDLYVRIYIANNPNTPPEALLQLVNDEDINVKRNIAKNSNTPPEALLQLANDKDINVRTSVANNPNTPPEVLAKLANDEDKNVKINIANNPKTPPEILVQLVNNEYGYIERYISNNPSIPLELLLQLANYENNNIRINIVNNPSTPLEVLAKLANDENEYVRISVAKNIKTPPEVLIQLANDEDINVIRNIAENLSTPPKVLAKLANDEDIYIRIYIARNTSTPPEVLEKLANDENKDVRRNIAENPSTPPEILEKLKEEFENISYEEEEEEEEEEETKPIPKVEQYYTQLPNFPIISNDYKENLEIASNPNISEDVISQLLRLQDPGINQALIDNPGIAENIKQKFKEEEYSEKYEEEYEDLYNKANEKINILLKYANLFNLFCKQIQL